MKKKICIVTGSRAEYGLFNPLLEEIKKEPMFQLQIAVTGMHLSVVHGLTYKEILHDGFRLNAKVKIPLGNDTPEGITKSLGIGIAGFANVFKKLKPEMVIVLGDRFETFAAAIAAFIANIPLVHLYGGELTEGLIDDAIRHSITKMSYLHFTSTESYRKRVIQLGEEPKRVFTVGALGIDNIKNLKFFTKHQLEKAFNFEFKEKTLLVTFNPVTLEKRTAKLQIIELLSAFDVLKDVQVIFTRPNADTNGRIIIKLVDQFVKNNSDRAVAFASLGRVKYLSALEYVDAVVGNSSSGIIEAASFKKPVINIGDRQRGRLKSLNVIDCDPVKSDIVNSLRVAFSDDFIKQCNCVINPYGDGKTAKRIVSILKRKFSGSIDLKKTFYNIQFAL